MPQSTRTFLRIIWSVLAAVCAAIASVTVFFGALRMFRLSANSGWAAAILFFITLAAWLAALGRPIWRGIRGYKGAGGAPQETEAAIYQLVETFCLSVELKDPYTRGHSERVAAYLQLLAEKVYGELTPQDRTKFRYAGLLHDVGKLYIPEHILKKPTKLVTDEFQYIRQHPQIGADIVAKIPSLEATLPIILHHHERFDGRGYPAGLRGREIPLDARIAAVADTFDAMTSSRAYRGAMNLDAALQEIISNSGTQFDPEVVKHFVRHYDAFRRMHEELQQKTWLPTAGM
ncbi:HD-GYP domain-containing protein [Alicyclobacillus cycloheptanicus]|uniref:Nucleotidyltransferase with HDIG domain n=1 Tax=Alicyclobacillus cycloheptanicus TaxID=1457 RepID=A0ABT9XI08_9BACL|nr:HD-GYP domain-containing protein [Alicyclobacillus cycloheptanicus]MDQ0189664.1 putative nucleotidyltransferase with HDIG domain [Alicyclobacillus cycloheptanicus]WDL99963.1 HD-GYP domain-containing protein [Alicyclobacillus cycloheptanicus]